MFLDPAVWPLARAARGSLALTSLVTLAASGASILAAFQLAAATTAILTGDGTPWAPLGIAALAIGVRALLLWSRDVLALATGTAVTARLRERLLEHIARLGPGHTWHGGQARAHLTAVEGCEHLRGYVGSYLPQAIAALLVPAVLVVVLALQDLLVAIVVVICLAFVPLAQRLTRALLGKRAAEHWIAYERYGARIGDSVSGLSTLVGLGAAERRAAVLQDEAEQLREATTRNMNISLSTYLVTGAAMLLGTAGATLLAAWHTADGALAPGAVVLVLFLAAECFRPLQDLQSFWHEGFYGIQAAISITALLETPAAVTEAGQPAPRRGEGPTELRIENASYRYPGATRDALHEVTAHIPAGRTTALVGRSGSGKSTLTALLLRDVDPTAGAITLDGQNLRQLPLHEVRRLAARVSQDVVLLDGTLEENIRCADTTEQAGSEERIQRAMDIARVNEFLPDLPLGAQSPVGEGGRLLSGGQRQRVALARALVQNAPLLVLDEATSALDGENEALISQALRENDGERTIVVIAHRLSTVAHADHIIVLEDGQVIEQGSPEVLAQRPDGHWAAMLLEQQISLHTPAESPHAPATSTTIQAVRA